MIVSAIDVQPGDVWLGSEEGDELHIATVTLSEGQFIPWRRGRTATPETLPAVVITGTMYYGSDRTAFEGQWTLQGDMPMEVRRADTS